MTRLKKASQVQTQFPSANRRPIRSRKNPRYKASTAAGEAALRYFLTALAEESASLERRLVIP